jgi:hypothetical protein
MEYSEVNTSERVLPLKSNKKSLLSKSRIMGRNFDIESEALKEKGKLSFILISTLLNQLDVGV